MNQQAFQFPENPDADEALRATYAKAGLRDQGISFEEAMKNPAIRTCLINTNHARLKAKGDSHA